jgi:peptide-methionine (S)-S-oxide reductase
MNMASETAVIGGGCFWCLEAVYQEIKGVQHVESGYTGGHIASPTYEQVCEGSTGHAEVVSITFDNGQISFREILEIFFTIHDPTTLNRQGNDTGTQYRSAIFANDDDQRRTAESSRAMYQERLTAAGFGPITTEIVGPPAPPFYFAEDYHQQYLDKNPNGYCPNHSTGVTLPDDFSVTPLQYVD